MHCINQYSVTLLLSKNTKYTNIECAFEANHDGGKEDEKIWRCKIRVARPAGPKRILESSLHRNRYNISITLAPHSFLCSTNIASYRRI